MRVDLDMKKKYREYLEMSKYSDNVKKNYMYYFHQLINIELNQERVEHLCGPMHSVYRSFMKTVMRCFKLPLDVPAIRGRKEHKEVIYFTKNDMNLILSNVKDLRLHIMIRLMYENGLRISEVLSLTKDNIDMVNQRVRGIGKGNKEYNMKIYDKTFGLLNQHYLKEFGPHQKIFHWKDIKHQRQKAWHEIKITIKQVLPYKKDREIFPHAFRHTCGTHLYQNKKDLRQIQTYLRHSQLETVARYTAVDKEKLEEEVKDIFNVTE